jgi:hypothetical protein
MNWLAFLAGIGLGVFAFEEYRLHRAITRLEKQVDRDELAAKLMISLLDQLGSKADDAADKAEDVAHDLAESHERATTTDTNSSPGEAADAAARLPNNGVK